MSNNNNKLMKWEKRIMTKQDKNLSFQIQRKLMLKTENRKWRTKKQKQKLVIKCTEDGYMKLNKKGKNRSMQTKKRKK